MRVKQKALNYEFKEFKLCVRERLDLTRPAMYFRIDLLFGTGHRFKLCGEK